jgi:predicted GIY-YIG superfamily endonuclease
MDEGETATPTDTWWVYVLTSKSGVRRTYVGVTTDPARRLRQHNGLELGGAASARAARPWRIGKLHGPFAGRSQAQKIEARIKRLSGRARLSWALAKHSD